MELEEQGRAKHAIPACKDIQTKRKDEKEFWLD
jgi:hypothetical protein